MRLTTQFRLALTIFPVAYTACLATTTSLTDTADTEIIQNNVSSTSKMHVGSNNTGVKHRSLLRFDLSSIPTNAVITNATLTVSVESVPAGAFNIVIDLRRSFMSWSDTQASWNNRSNGVLWSIPGGATNVDFS